MSDGTLVCLEGDNRSGADSRGRYVAFGLTVSSCLPCPELYAADGVTDAAVTIRYGDVPSALPEAQFGGVRYQAVPGRLLLRVDGIARFLVRDGCEIVIERDPGASDDDVRRFLLGSVFGALLHQRGHLVLHGSCVAIDDGCAVFLGGSSDGKSTVAAALVQRGHQCLADDVSALSLGPDGVPYAVPAYPQVELWVDSLQHLGIDPAGLRRVRPTLEKRAWPVAWTSTRSPGRIKRVFLLSRAKKRARPQLEPIEGAARIDTLLQHTYQRGFLPGLGLRVHNLKQIGAVCARVPVTRIFRSGQAFQLEQIASAVEGALRS